MQEDYCKIITERYRKYCTSTDLKDSELGAAFASLNLVSDGNAGDPPTGRHAPNGVHETSSQVVAKDSNGSSKELAMIVMAMRKLREGLVASSRYDSFAQHAYMFIIRAAILTSTFESYHPALLRLLYHMQPLAPLPTSEVQEFAGYHILDLSCRQGRLGEAFEIRKRWGIEDEHIDNALKALVREDWVLFWRIFKVVTEHQRRLMAWAEGDMRKHALKCIGRSYFTAEKYYVERNAGRSWKDLKEKDGVVWDLEGDTVVVKRIKKAK